MQLFAQKLENISVNWQPYLHKSQLICTVVQSLTFYSLRDLRVRIAYACFNLAPSEPLSGNGLSLIASM